ncbi:hypothetical protein [Sphingopyxis bauzanensis]|uniref:hypothetical protein n=1 Tax=Sphingopyxis bauzanensis TaxID=651663 RepID=UPI00191C867A|nr:hypothetical protein [Sphingopyxis bauzanensis]
MQLHDVIFGQVNRIEMREDHFHDLRVASNFLLVARFKGFDFEVGQKPFDLGIGEFAPLDARARADALDRRHAAQRRKAFRRERTKRSPRALEFIDLGDEGEDLRRNLQGIGFQGHTQ